MERDKIVKASFFGKTEKQLEFLIKALAKIVGKENINYLVPKYHHKSHLFIVNMDIRIPDALLRYIKPSSNEPSEEEGR